MATRLDDNGPATRKRGNRLIMQCPKCQLRFSTRGEVLWHLRQDHRRTRGLDVPDRLRGPARRHHRPAVTTR
jgi:hypothetical protein